MENNSKEIEKLVAQSKKLGEISSRKQRLEDILLELNICNNVAYLCKRRKSFQTNVLKVSCKVNFNANSPDKHTQQVLVISVHNVSEKLVFSNVHWQFCIGMNNDITQSAWNLDISLKPGQIDTFCCPINKTIPVEKISFSLKFMLQFESKLYTRLFNVQEFVIDALHCLDPGKLLFETCSTPSTREMPEIYNCSKSKVPFPSITKFMLKLEPSLKEKFVQNILLQDSFHRGFSNELVNQNEISVFYAGHRIDINIPVKGDIVAIKCEDSTVLCAVKASILRRLVSIPGVAIDGLDDMNLEKLNSLRLKLNAFESDCTSDSIEVDDLMELYLELRDISESIRFSLVHVIE